MRLIEILQDNGFTCSQSNPGLIHCKTNKLSYVNVSTQPVGFLIYVVLPVEKRSEFIDLIVNKLINKYEDYISYDINADVDYNNGLINMTVDVNIEQEVPEEFYNIVEEIIKKVQDWGI